MLSYPSIDSIGTSRIERSTTCFAFVKYDGSNLRFQWSKKSGFQKFGTRRELFDHSHPVFGKAVDMIRDLHGPKLLEDLLQIDKRALSSGGQFTGFAEFFGPNSFAGTHHEQDEHQLRIFDASIFRKGFVPPSEFSLLCNESELYARFLGRHSFGQELTDAVYSGGWTPAKHLLQAIDEGIILKTSGRQGPLSVKLKTKMWLDMLRGRFDDWESRA